MNREPTVFIVDDDPAACESVGSLVGAMGMATESFDSAEAFLAQYDAARPGCLITDLRMPGLHGVQLQEELGQMHSRLPVIMISGYANVRVTVRAMRQGAVTLLEKPYRDQELAHAVHEALSIDAAHHREMSQFDDLRHRLHTLSPEEQQVMEDLIEGRANKSIAKRRDLGLRTVERRRQTVFAKMGVESVAELTRKVTLLEAKPKGGRGTM